MPQSLSQVILHLIFSTKNREPWLDADVRPRMHAYLATICRDLDAEAFRVGGVTDHVHLVVTLPRTLSQSALVEEIKKLSSKWIKGLDPKYRQFYWQRGYGAFSLGRSQLDAVDIQFGRGDGHDVVDLDTNGIDVLRFKAGIVRADVRLSRAGDDLEVSLDGGADSVTVRQWFAGAVHQIERIVFADNPMGQGHTARPFIGTCGEAHANRAGQHFPARGI